MRRIPRWLARAPIGLFRAGLGWVFAGRLVLVEHLGRSTRQRRFVVLEAVGREPGAVVVASGYGRQAQWFRNIEVEPRIRLWCGRVTAAAGRGQILTPQEAHGVLERYRCRSPGRARFAARVLDVPQLASSGPLPADVGERVPLVRLRCQALNCRSAAE